MTNRAVYAVVVLLTVGVLPCNAQRKPHKAIPPELTAEFESPMQPGDADARLRHSRGSRFERRGAAIVESERTSKTQRFIHGWKIDDALPFSLSDAVMVGQVMRGQAFLTPAKTTVYSEYSIVPSDIIRDSTGTITQHQVIAVDREGGAVRFPSGKIQTYEINDLGFLTEHHIYLLFLKYSRDAQAFSLVTAYDVTTGTATAVDGSEGSTDLPYNKYNGVSAAALLDDTRMRAITNADKR